MRLLVPLLALLLAVPLAAADHGGKLPHVDYGEYDAGPCTVGWSVYWPGDHAWATCAAAGHEAFWASYGSAALGHTCHVRAVDGTFAFTCPNTYQTLDDVLP